MRKKQVSHAHTPLHFVCFSIFGLPASTPPPTHTHTQARHLGLAYSQTLASSTYAYIHIYLYIYDTCLCLMWFTSLHSSSFVHPSLITLF
ncbi:hypothetical protein, unlikely [Trypanosoma brucei gambiense DAL972]|uniref:Uncharacterized protein n=1 Tax=Trypanosoma brucei gambiense (strain MHOM/CI/86/DAL972) TaxID=679716 RepID=C9ZIM8_TRYB9|nr:hypothetical protein, unlikely [Trypanosoma brucei gambiense DAL972]CBH09020.1 hypothetical protein, unlikely [Trypanosoma brucei gambiense DAL972]|eukprot:XP_011771461.1 hypothetical protein, unlikely [Trypanosoma brucei gambiense DAL972]